MAAPISDTVSITITQDSVGIARAGFGVPLLLSALASFPERVRYYGSLSEVAEDFPTTTAPEYLFAARCFAQSPAPARIGIGRSVNKPTQTYTVEVAAVHDAHTYAIDVAGNGFTSATATAISGSSATKAAIHAALVTALNDVEDRNYTAALAPLVYADKTFVGLADDDTLTIASHGLLTGDGPVRVSNAGGALPGGLSTGVDYYVIRIDTNTLQLATSRANAFAGTAIELSSDGTGTQTLADTLDTVRPDSAFIVTGDAPGEWLSLAVSAADFSIAQTHADPGVAGDLSAIQLESGDWYALYTAYNSDAYVKAAAAWIATQKKIYVLDMQETIAITVASDGTQGTIDDLMALGHRRTSVLWHRSPEQMAGAGWLASRLPLEPGVDNWKFATLVGVSPESLTTTHRVNLRARNANSYETTAGLGRTWDGKMADGSWIDSIRNRDWLEDDMSKAVYEVLSSVRKVPFTDAGIALVVNAMKGSLKRAVARGILAEGFTITYPRAEDVSLADKAARILPDLKWSATEQGAVNKANITGVISL